MRIIAKRRILDYAKQHPNAAANLSAWITVDTALRLERCFGWPADIWLNLQSHHDQQTAKESLKSALDGIQPCPAL